MRKAIWGAYAGQEQWVKVRREVVSLLNHTDWGDHIYMRHWTKNGKVVYPLKKLSTILWLAHEMEKIGAKIHVYSGIPSDHSDAQFQLQLAKGGGKKGMLIRVHPNGTVSNTSSLDWPVSNVPLSELMSIIRKRFRHLV